MAENIPQDNRSRKEKNPTLAAFLSIFPSGGAFYNGNVLKGIAYFFLFVILIILADESRDPDSIVFGLMLGGFYIYQIVDSYNEARRLNQIPVATSNKDGEKSPENISLFAAVLVLVLGIIFLLINFSVLTYRQVSKLWPLLLVAFGVRFILNYFIKGETNHGQQ